MVTQGSETQKRKPSNQTSAVGLRTKQSRLASLEKVLTKTAAFCITKLKKKDKSCENEKVNTYGGEVIK